MPIIVEPTVNPQSTVALTEVFLNDADDPTDFVVLAYVGDSLQVTSVAGGGVDHDYASGRSRAWSDESDVTHVRFTATNVTLDDITWLRNHRGQTVWFRDHVGNKVPVVYHTADPSYSTMPLGHPAAFHTVPLQMESVTDSEAV